MSSLRNLLAFLAESANTDAAGGAVTLTFHESKVAKVVGTVAVDRPKTGAVLQVLYQLLTL